MRAERTATGVLVVDLGALARNYHKLCAAAAPAECAAVVKANAYGLGVGPVVTRLVQAGCRRFFVATLAEGQQVRAFAPDASIYVLEGALPNCSALLADSRLAPVLNSLSQCERWAAEAPVRPAALHLDTGMSRLGLTAREVEQLVCDDELLDRLDIEYLVTHLACADEPDHPLNRVQLERFEALRARLPAWPVSVGNSASILAEVVCDSELVRPGFALYGGNPFADRDGSMETVITLKAQILQIREIDEPVNVGYGATYTAKPHARLATLGLGYADGYPRALGNAADAAVAGRRVPVVGRVSMDLMCVDISGVPPGEVACGDWVELVGATVTLDEVAAAARTIGYEILTGLGQRLHREYVN